jgi:transposase
MNVHQNARLTPQGRLLLVRRITEEGWRVADAANAAGISVRQSYRWLARYRSGGAAALADRSSAPQRCKHRIGAEWVGEIERLRRQRMSGPAMARQLHMPVSTVGAILRRLGLGKLATLEPKPVVVRYERERAGELIHLDSKKLGRIEGIGHRGQSPPRHRLGSAACVHR